MFSKQGDITGNKWFHCIDRCQHLSPAKILETEAKLLL